MDPRTTRFLAGEHQERLRADGSGARTGRRGRRGRTGGRAAWRVRFGRRDPGRTPARPVEPVPAPEGHGDPDGGGTRGAGHTGDLAA